jgi:hypothetical protein
MAHVIQSNTYSEKQMSREELIWLGAVVDCEGTVSMYAASPKGNRVTPHIQTLVRVSSTSLEFVEKVRDIAGNGDIRKQETLANPCYVWQLQQSQVRHVLPQLLPFLMIKKRRAELVLEVLSVKGHRFRPGESRDDYPRLREMLEEVQSLNEKGKYARASGDKVRDVRIARGICDEEGCNSVRYPEQRWCYRHWLRNRPKEVRNCLNCGVEMECMTARKKYCSHECQATGSYNRRRQPKPEVAG